MGVCMYSLVLYINVIFCETASWWRSHFAICQNEVFFISILLSCNRVHRAFFVVLMFVWTMLKCLKY
jgi:hypothetical protein